MVRTFSHATVRDGVEGRIRRIVQIFEVVEDEEHHCLQLSLKNRRILYPCFFLFVRENYCPVVELLELVTVRSLFGWNLRLLLSAVVIEMVKDSMA